MTQISAEIIQIFANAPVQLSSCIRIAEFAQLIEDRTRAFVGRDFIFDAIDGHLRDPGFSSGYIVVRGEPGIGKTSLMAQLAKTRQYVHHFNIAAQNIRSTRDFLSNICAQLIVRHQLGYSQLPPEAVHDSGFLARLLREASVKDTEGRIVVLIDALDEAEDLGLDAGANRLYLPTVLPPKVFFVITTREQEDYQLVVDHRRDIYLRKDDPQNEADVRHYIRSFVAANEATMANRISQWSLDESRFESVLTAKSEGNFMYLVHVLADIRDGTISETSLGNIDELPIGLRQYYERHWRTMKAHDAEQFERVYQPVVCMLAVVREPVSLARVEEWTAIPAIRVRESGQAMACLPHADQVAVGGAALPHLSGWFSGFLAGGGRIERLSPAVRCSSARQDSRLPNPSLSKVLVSPEEANPFDALNPYELQHLAFHLSAAARMAELNRLVTLSWSPRTDHVSAESEVSNSGIAPSTGRRNAWYDAKERAGDAEGYTQDLEIAWTLAEASSAIAVKSGAEAAITVGFEVRYALMRACVTSMASSLPGALLCALVEHRFWTPKQALATARQCADEIERTQLTAALVGVLPPEQRDDIAKGVLEAVDELSIEVTDPSTTTAESRDPKDLPIEQSKVLAILSAFSEWSAAAQGAAAR